MLPVSDTGQQNLVEVAQDVGERLGIIWRRRWQPRADIAGLDLSQHRQLTDPLEIPSRPFERRGAVGAQIGQAVGAQIGHAVLSALANS